VVVGAVAVPVVAGTVVGAVPPTDMTGRIIGSVAGDGDAAARYCRDRDRGR
jgi:hypothetical protein